MRIGILGLIVMWVAAPARAEDAVAPAPLDHAAQMQRGLDTFKRDQNHLCLPFLGTR